MLSGEASLQVWREARARLDRGIPKPPVFHCPTCGSSIEACTPLSSLASIRLAPGQRSILDAVTQSYPRSIHRDVLVDMLYVGRPGGGPVSARSCLFVFTHRLNRKLKQFGWHVCAMKSDMVSLHPIATHHE